MTLFEHNDFEQAILGAEQHFAARKLRPAIIEKDYYVMVALRIIAAAAPDKTIFKGGTSLAKGWNLNPAVFGRRHFPRSPRLTVLVQAHCPSRFRYNPKTSGPE